MVSKEKSEVIYQSDSSAWGPIRNNHNRKDGITIKTTKITER